MEILQLKDQVSEFKFTKDNLQSYQSQKRKNSSKKQRKESQYEGLLESINQKLNETYSGIMK
jgi:hypothetical protein